MTRRAGKDLRGDELIEAIGAPSRRDKKVTSSVDNESTRSAVMKELKQLRRREGAATVDAMGLAPTICMLLGGGDPRLAFTRLQHHILDAMDSRAITAAAVSLGFLSDGTTHLARLTDGESFLHVNQRQVRRYSDEGLGELAALIATNWTVEAVPELSIDLIGQQANIAIFIAAHRPLVVEMSDPVVEVVAGSERMSAAIAWTRTAVSGRASMHPREPVHVPRSTQETSLIVQWRGEMWPKFSVRLHPDVSPNSIESLGNRVMVRLWSAAE